jgi:hypothetical protein
VIDDDDLRRAAEAYRSAESRLGLAVATARLAEENWLDIAQKIGTTPSKAFDLYVGYVSGFGAGAPKDTGTE